MDEGCAGLIGVLVIIAIAIALIVYVVLPITILVLGGIALAGICSGIWVAGKNFGEVLIEAHKTIP